jgi:hypothetical protein
MDLRTRIENGEFNPGSRYPQKPVKPAILFKRAGDLSLDDLKRAPEMAEAYARDMEAYRIEKAAYRSEEQRLLGRFMAEALVETGLVGHKNADRIWAKAWEDGHSNGLAEVLLHLENLAELVL